jgi:hypothetical protein
MTTKESWTRLGVVAVMVEPSVLDSDCIRAMISRSLESRIGSRVTASTILTRFFGSMVVGPATSSSVAVPKVAL